VGKAVKVRFLEGYNSREVLDFNLFLSPNDVWTARVSEAGEGAAVFTDDASCTAPAIPAGGAPFRTAAFDGSSVFPADSGPQDLTRTREGYVEIIEMGEIIPGSALDGATTHNQNGVPNGGVPSCSGAINGNNPAGDLSAPGGGLFGSGMIVNVGVGTFFSYNADAVDGFSDSIQFSGPGGLTPSLQQASTPLTSAFPGGAVAYVFANGSLLTLDYPNGIDAVSAVFAADAIYN
jgi:hypothetical protein